LNDMIEFLKVMMVHHHHGQHHHQMTFFHSFIELLLYTPKFNKPF
jgi:hypothetical protein